MFFNRSSKLLIVAAVLAALFVACAQENELHNPQRQIGFGAKVQCLEDATSTIARYFEGELSQQELIGFWDCAEQAVGLFGKYVKGQQPNTYHANELRNYLQTYFLGSMTIQDALLTEAMEIKRLFLGGDVQQLTRQELLQTQWILRELRSMTLEMQPFMKVMSARHKLIFNNASATDIEAYDQALVHLRSVAHRFGGLIARQKLDYSFDRLEALLIEVEVYLNQKNPKKEASEFAKMIPVIRTLKSLLVGPDAQVIKANEWAQAFTSTAESLGVWLRYLLFVNSQNWYYGLGLEQVHVSMGTVEQLLSAGLQARPSQQFQLSEVRALVLAYAEFADMEASTEGPEFVAAMTDTYKAAASRLLRPVGEPPSHTNFGLNKLSFLRSEFDRWYAIQAHYTRQLPEANRSLRHLNPAVLTGALEEMQRVLSNVPWPLVNDSKRRVLIGHSEMGHNPRTLTTINWERALVRSLVHGYATDDSDQQALLGLTQPELSVAFTDLRPLAVWMDLIDADNFDFYKRIYREGNLFMPRSNADYRVSFEEGVEYLHYILAGINATGFMLDEVKGEVGFVSQCRHYQEPDGGFRIDTDCFRRFYRQQFAKHFSHMPKMVNYIVGLNAKEWRSLLNALERTVREEGASNTPIHSSDINEMNILLQYLETFLLRFDADGNEKLGLSEVYKALPYLIKLIAELLDMDPEQDAEELTVLVTFMMKYGGLPSADDWKSGVEFEHWRLNQDKWELAADRRILALVVAALADM